MKQATLEQKIRRSAMSARNLERKNALKTPTKEPEILPEKACPFAGRGSVFVDSEFLWDENPTLV